ncbi:MAG: PD40 domain-containing protein [Anaerolineae bacterium]|nr:PD40 domain-containing protein [Anaerolineae bacterium]
MMRIMPGAARTVTVRLLMLGSALWIALAVLVLGARQVGQNLPGGVVMFLSRSTGRMELLLCDVRGGPIFSPLPGYTEQTLNPVWSPDGTRLAFEAEALIYLYTPGAGVTGPVSATYPLSSTLVWSPDSAHLLFGANQQGDYVLVWLDLATSETRELVRQDSTEYNAAWSPDGRHIAYRSEHEVRVYDLATGGILTPPLAGDQSAPAWSPDGSQLALVLGQDLYLWDVAAGTMLPLVADGSAAYSPAWSPDGTQIAYESDRDGDWNVYALNVADGTTRRIAGTPDRDDRRPAWSPDGHWIAFESRQPTMQGNLDIYVLDVTTGDVRRLTDHPADDYRPSWWP